MAADVVPKETAMVLIPYSRIPALQWKWLDTGLNIWERLCHKQVSMADTSNYIPQYLWMQLLVPAFDSICKM